MNARIVLVLILTVLTAFAEARTFRWDGADFAHVATHPDFARSKS